MRKSILLLGMLLILASPLIHIAPATTEIVSISPTTGPPGTTVRIIGEIDTKGGYYQIIGFGLIVKEGQCAVNNKTVDTTFTVPDYPFGPETILLLDKAKGTINLATFTITTKYSVSAPRRQEGLNTTITVSLKGGVNATAYEFNITVAGPAGRRSAKMLTTAPTVNGSASVTASYYGDFPPGANTDFNGTYTMLVDEKHPGTLLNVTTGSFIIGLTNETTYKRFETVHIQGSGYNSTETVTVNITFGGTPIAGYPKNVTAYANGTVTDSWTIPGNASLGTYTVSLTGRCVACNATKRTVKEPGDAQNFTVVAIQVLAVIVTDQPLASYQRTETARVRFRVQYPDGTNFTSADLGSIQVRVYRNATNIMNVTLGSANFDPTTNEWTAGWVILWDAPLGIGYKFMLYTDEVADKHGNRGPADSVSSSSFSVVKAVLDVDSIHADKATYLRGETVTVYFSAKYPNGSAVTTGSAAVTLTKADGNAKQITATYVLERNRYEARYTIKPGDPIGLWTAQLAAYALEDDADNTGPASIKSTTFTVVSPMPPTVVTTRIHPETLNLRSRERWITVEIRVPEGYDASDIDVGSIRPNHALSVDSSGPKEMQGRKLIVKFDRASVASLIRGALGTSGSKFATVTLTVTGQISGTSFQSSDAIRVKA